MRDQIGAERGWPPMRRDEFDHEAQHGSLYVGAPETVARRIAATAKALGAARFDLKYSAGMLSHAKLMRCITLYGSKGGAELIVENYAPSGSLRVFTDDDGVPAETRLTAQPGGGHKVVVEQFLAKIRSGRWHEHDGTAAIDLARIVDACYRSAAEQREVRLTE